MNRILIINGHPNASSFCQAIANTYANAASKTGHSVVLLNLHELEFDLHLRAGYQKEQILEKDLVMAQEKIKWAEHVVIIHPVWWGSVPALLKGFFDRTLLPGFAFKYRKNSALWDKLLSGKTGHVIYTSDTPNLIYKYFFLAPSVVQVKKRTLEFCGISPVKVTAIAPVRKSTQHFREKWLAKIEQLAQQQH